MEGFIQTAIGPYTVIEFFDSSLMDPAKLEDLQKKLLHLIDAEDRRCIVLDFSRVEYISSQFIGTLLAMQKRLAKLPKSSLQLCSVNKRLTDLLRVTKLDKILTLKASQKDAVVQDRLLA